MSEGSFTRRWLIALGLLVVAALAFPLLLRPLLGATACAGTGGACGAVALLAGIVFRLPLVIGVGVYIARLAYLRSRTIGLYPAAFLFVLSVYLAAAPALFGVGNVSSAAFTLGVDPRYGVTAFGLLVAALLGLGALSPKTATRPLAARSTTFAIGALSMILLLPASLRGAALIPLSGPWLKRVSYQLEALFSPMLRAADGKLALAVPLCFTCTLLWWLIATRRSTHRLGATDA
ncbi:hypothetical protein KZ813_16310 [Sphingomonas sp. RHCKR7]|uniref:hypothetical protein n=1 Tax=Sphingomonas folli TaxID=2862497 RepID=UPI001CA55ABB|nr:hypothetical protein [Sphingomonas folli]MBW6528407.1 hypothetical protein [Sphingomonas folli]